MLLYARHTNKTKCSHSGLLMLMFDQGAMTICLLSGFSPVSPGVLVPAVAGVCPCGVTTVPRCLSDHGAETLGQPSWLVLTLMHEGLFLTPHPLSCKDLAVPGKYRAGPVQKQSPLSSWEGHQPHFIISFEEWRYFVGTGRNGKEELQREETQQELVSEGSRQLPGMQLQSLSQQSTETKAPLESTGTGSQRERPDGAGAEAGILSLSLRVCAKRVGPKGN